MSLYFPPPFACQRHGNLLPSTPVGRKGPDTPKNIVKKLEVNLNHEHGVAEKEYPWAKSWLGKIFEEPNEAVHRTISYLERDSTLLSSMDDLGLDE